jgi:glycosyltransferase involved in cell wall biosynthesis
VKLILVCNYPLDRQQSMLRFGALLREQWQRRGWEVECLAPKANVITTRLAASRRGSKWAGYLDKYILFPSQLARSLRATRSTMQAGHAVVHVVDHSNSVYVPQHPGFPWVVTCHDLLAVRGALGEDTDCPASRLGRWLQRAIVRGLGRATAIVSDSSSTGRDVERLVPAPLGQLRRTISLSLHHPYRRIARDEALARLGTAAGVPWMKPFLLHVGSNLPRKNKPGVLRVFAQAAGDWPGNLVFCGAEIPPEVRELARSLGLSHRVFAQPVLSDPQLEAAYSLAHALVFPSKCEGFGWPVIEAQACGCPVICSDRTSLPEVGGIAALVYPFEDEAGMAHAVRQLVAPEMRSAVAARGAANLQRFTTDRMIDAYGEVYQKALAAWAAR